MDTAASATAEAVLQVDSLTLDLRLGRQTVRVLHEVTFEVGRGEAVAVVGESGSGKSMTALALMGLLPSPPALSPTGRVMLDGTDLLRCSQNELRKIRGARISMIFQDALSALNPVVTVGAQISEAIRTHRPMNRRAARERAIELMDDVGIASAETRFHSFPHEFSGGMRQRVVIAMALACDPQVILADEPTTALDVTIQAQIMALLNCLRRERQMALVLITHDLGVVADVADRVVVMYAGRIVETADVLAVFEQSAHPYTAGLLDSIPARHVRGERLAAIPGSPPQLTEIVTGCPYRKRCAHAREICGEETPQLREVRPGRQAACHFSEELLSDT